MHKSIFLFLFLSCFLSFSFGNQNLYRTRQDIIYREQFDLGTNNYRNETELLEFIDSTMVTDLIPGLSISIVKDYNIVWQKHFGYANIDDNILVDENTMFILSSISKTVTATALMQLFEQDFFLLDDDIDDHLPFDIKHPDYPEVSITFKMLLSHTSGIKDNWDFMPYYEGDSPLDLNYYLNQYLTPGGEFYNSNLNFTDSMPGTSWRYSNIGTALIGLLVEEISGQLFNEYCNENIFEPLEMDNSYWFLSEIENLNQVALPYQLTEGSPDTLMELENYGYSDYPSGQLRTTSNNLAKFMSAFINNGIYNGVEILESETIELIKTVHYPDVALDQGLIWYYRYLNGRTLFGHGGADLGSLTKMFISFSGNLGVILLTNSRSHDGLIQIENAIFGYAEETDFTATGDINLDDVIDMQDIILLVNLIMNGELTFLADLNSDNTVNVFDLLELVEIIID